MQTLKFGNTVVELFEDRANVILHDGIEIPAAPHQTESYLETARKHGYGEDVTRLCLDHEVCHVALAEFLGLSESPVMRSVASHNSESTLLTGAEEDAVLSLQRYAMLAGVDLIKLFAKN